MNEILFPIILVAGIGLIAGLGLAIAKELVLLQNGNISVQSDRPHGTTFCVALPGASNEA